MKRRRPAVPHRPHRRVLLLLGRYWPSLHHGIARYARTAGWILDNTYASSGYPPPWWRGDGMLTLITNPKDYRALQLYPKLPLVDLSKGWITNALPASMRPSGVGRPRVLYDNAAIGRLAAQHFIERGFHDVALLNIGNFWMETERIPAFRAELEQAHRRYHEIASYNRFSIRMPHPRLHDERLAHRWLANAIRQLPRPIGIFAPNDEAALKVLHACDEAGLRVPEEAAVLGCNNDPMICEFSFVPMSSVDNDLERQGYEAAQLLDRLMDGQPAPAEPILIPPKGVVVRQSTHILAVSHPQVARALRFIWEYYREPIQTGDVAQEAGLSRRTLEKAFPRHIGHSIAQEINRRRLDDAKRLLLTTDLKAHEVAAQAGYSGMVQFSRAFKRGTGHRPSHYRRAAKETGPTPA